MKREALCWYCTTPILACSWVQSNGKEPVEGSVVEWHMMHVDKQEKPLGVVVKCPMYIPDPEFELIRRKEDARRKMMRKGDLPEECEKIQELLDAGRNYTEIAKELGCSSPTISKKVKKFGLKRTEV